MFTIMGAVSAVSAVSAGAWELIVAAAVGGGIATFSCLTGTVAPVVATTGVVPFIGGAAVATGVGYVTKKFFHSKKSK